MEPLTIRETEVERMESYSFRGFHITVTFGITVAFSWPNLTQQ